MDTPGPCRVCGRPSWLADQAGPVHLCCSSLPADATECGACRRAEAAEAEWQGRGKGRARRKAEAVARLVAAGDHR